MGETKKVEVNGGNNHWDFKKAIENKTTCATCGFGGGPFFMQGRGAPGQLTPVAPVFACENTESLRYMSIGTGMASCECHRKKEQSRILIAHKPVPPLTIGDLKGDKK